MCFPPEPARRALAAALARLLQLMTPRAALSPAQEEQLHALMLRAFM
jgi:hypothetical protein